MNPLKQPDPSDESLALAEEYPYWIADPHELVTGWPLGVQRCFFIYSVKNGIMRGKHRHQHCHMALHCPKGSVTIYAQTPTESLTYRLDKTQPWLVLPPTVWRMMYAFSPDAILMALASMPYDRQDQLDAPYRPFQLDERTGLCT